MSYLPPSVIWIAFFLLGIGGLLYTSYPKNARTAVSIGWGTFGIYWLTMTPHYLYAKDSFIEGALCVIAFPISLYAGWLTYKQGSEALATVGKGVATMGLLYLPVEQIDSINRFAIESVTVQTVWIVEFIFDHTLRIQEGPIKGYQSGIAAPEAPGGLLLTHIELACTGLGSIAIVVGLIAVLEEPIYHRLIAALVSTILIYALNVVRTVFITSAYIGQWFQFYVPDVLAFTGYSDPRVTSFFIADKVISQSLSVVVLLAMFYIGLRVFPSLSQLFKDVVNAPTTR